MTDRLFTSADVCTLTGIKIDLLRKWTMRRYTRPTARGQKQSNLWTWEQMLAIYLAESTRKRNINDEYVKTILQFVGSDLSRERIERDVFELGHKFLVIVPEQGGWLAPRQTIDNLSDRALLLVLVADMESTIERLNAKIDALEERKAEEAERMAATATATATA